MMTERQVLAGSPPAQHAVRGPLPAGAPPALLTSKQAAERLGCSVKSLQRWAAKGYIPVLLMPSGHRRFHPADVEALLERMNGVGESA